MKTLGLDIGGANLKAAHSDGAASSRAYALWQKPTELLEQLRALAREMPPFDRLAVTMTAELCDCFDTKRSGVSHVLDAAEALASGKPLYIWGSEGRFVDSDEAGRHALRCAAANWHALASFVARTLHPIGRTLLIDTGSTTTDILMLCDGRVDVQGRNDMQRLASGELVYVGIERTPLMALCTRIVWNGQTYGVMAEHFATTADVYLLTGDLPPQPDRTDTADTRPRTVPCAAGRLVRMIGADLEMLSIEDARQLAHIFAGVVQSRLVGAIGQVLGDRSPDRVLVSGSGGSLASSSANAALPHDPVQRLADLIGPEAADAACAHALVRLCDACG